MSICTSCFHEGKCLQCACTLVCYCSKECQNQHWKKTHKDYCITTKKFRGDNSERVKVLGFETLGPMDWGGFLDESGKVRNGGTKSLGLIWGFSAEGKEHVMIANFSQQESFFQNKIQFQFEGQFQVSHPPLQQQPPSLRFGNLTGSNAGPSLGNR